MSSDFSGLTPDQLHVLASYPLIPPPKGVMPNFINPVDHNKPLYIITSLLFGIMTIFVFIRAYTKTYIVRSYSWDDCMYKYNLLSSCILIQVLTLKAVTTIFAVIGVITYYIVTLWGFQRGRIGVHEWDINIRQGSSLNLLIPAYLLMIVISPTMLFVKVTFFLLYLQLFRPMRWLRICAYIGAVFTFIFYSGMAVAQLAFSTPQHGETLLSHQETHNEDLAIAMSVPQSVVGLAIDLYILIIPIIAVSQLQLPIRKKVGVILIFMTGLLACLSSLLSIYYRVLLNRTDDLVWAFMPVNTVTLVEMFVGVTCACTPSAAHACRYHLPSLVTFFNRNLSSLRSVFGKGSLRNSSTALDENPMSKEHCTERIGPNA